MGFRRQMKHRTRGVLGEDGIQGGGVADIGLDEDGLGGQGLQAGGIAQTVKGNDGLVPRAVSWRHRADPIKPAAPVTKIDMSGLLRLSSERLNPKLP